MLEGVHEAMKEVEILDLEAPGKRYIPRPEPLVLGAYLTISPYGRPSGWYLQFDSPSIVYALLQARHVLCGHKVVQLKSLANPPSQAMLDQTARLSESTLRVENCSSEYMLMNALGRYDVESIEQLRDDTYLVHMVDATWARAVLRERQGFEIQGRKVVLAPYPKQLR